MMPLLDDSMVHLHNLTFTFDSKLVMFRENMYIGVL